ncbi:hypothetical protein ROA7450_02497 [Roseovarius albus]|uniref:Uncharacterized protein n=1 Tax=Roseovarius albus TaxID=1247867 RepID=A0A1X6ZG59_9RHOB|nr:hypothetical protein [Roseovarius albus]SLN50411.1 hypothetical protein ROA7450_02497 [Roseovarius albus]
MYRLLKLLVYMGLLAFVALTGYAYIGPFFGADFSAPQQEIRQEILLETQ